MVINTMHRASGDQGLEMEMQTNRYALIDNASGYIWGVTDAETPAHAAAIIDAEFGETRQYEEVSNLASNETGYHVYSAPAGFEVADGRDDDKIAVVSALPRVAILRTSDA